VLTVNVQSFGDVPILRCSGRIVRGDEIALLCAAVQQQKHNMILDLTEVDAIDAAGIGLLVTLQAAGFYLTLMNPTAQVHDTLRVTKLDSIFEITELLSPEALVDGVAVNA
jgi:anti-anti-sigma factor